MRYLTFSETELTKYPICLLVSHIRKDEIQRAYIDPFSLDQNEILVVDLHYSQTQKTTPMKEMRQYVVEELVPVLNDMGVEHVVCTDANYFKALTKLTKVDVNLGYVVESPYGPWKIIYAPSYRAIFYDPEKVKSKIAQGINALIAERNSAYAPPGADIIHFAEYPKTTEDIRLWLLKLLEMNKPLTCDIEAFSLKHHTSGIGTITFCWSKHEGIAFPVDYGLNPSDAKIVRGYLKEFFQAFREKIMYHRITFDVYILVYQLFMDNLLDTEGLLKGMDILLKDWDDTQLITYLATNSCAGNKLGLKDQAQEFAGNYAKEEIDDITKIPLDELLEYNLVDGLSTWYVWEKHYQTMLDDKQEDIYVNVLKPAVHDIIQMQLTGLPLNMERVKEVKQILQTDSDTALQTIMNNPVMQEFTYMLRESIAEKKNAKWKVKRITVAEVTDEFNPNSGPQLQMLLYEYLGLPILAYTKSKQPATGGDTLEDLVNHTNNQDVKDLLKAFIDYKAVVKILTSFIPAFENAAQGPDGWHYLFGNFNLGGTLSCRLSSSDPNLQNIPATGSKYAKVIKSCFQAPPGWLFMGLDFNSLEDKISALTSKDPNKLKVYTDGYDGHSLRAFAYFRENMLDIRQSDDRRTYKITIEGKSHMALEDDLVTTPTGQTMTVLEYVNLLGS